MDWFGSNLRFQLFVFTQNVFSKEILSLFQKVDPICLLNPKFWVLSTYLSACLLSCLPAPRRLEGLSGWLPGIVLFPSLSQKMKWLLSVIFTLPYGICRWAAPKKYFSLLARKHLLLPNTSNLDTYMASFFLRLTWEMIFLRGRELIYLFEIILFRIWFIRIALLDLLVIRNIVSYLLRSGRGTLLLSGGGPELIY